MSVHLADLQAAVELTTGEPPALDLDELGADLVDLDSMIAELRTYRDSLHAALVDRTAGMREPLEIGGHVFERQHSKNRRAWDNEALRSAVARVVLADADGLMRSGLEVWTDILAAFNLSGGAARMRWLKEHGIDPDDYSDGTPVTTIRAVA